MNFKVLLKENKSKIYNYVFIILCIAITVFFMSSIGVFATNTAETKANFIESFNTLSKLIRQISSFMVGFSVISGIGTMIFHLIRLGGCASNPQARAKVIQDMLTTGFCIALLGSINMIILLILAWY